MGPSGRECISVQCRAGRSARSTYAGLHDLVFFASGVIARPGLDLVTLLVLDLQLAVAAVELGIGGGIADVVLAAQFSRDLVEGFPELIELVADIDDPATGLLREFLHFALTTVADAHASVESAVGT